MDKETIDAILQAVRAPVILSGHSEDSQFALVPSGMTAIELSKFLGRPDRIQQVVESLSVESFCAYVQRHGNAQSVIFANEPSANYEAVLDYHRAGQQVRSDCEHIMRYQCPHSDQWKAWNAGSGKLIGQEEFAAFLEANLHDIRKPVGADMLQIALHLQVHKSAQFESGIRLDNGEVQFRYSEEIRGTAGGKKVGDLKIPPTFELALPVFVDGTVWPVCARFRYRMNEGKLFLGYELIRPQEVFRAAVKSVTVQIAKGLPAVALFQGVRR